MDLKDMISLFKELISIDTSNPPGKEEEICNYLTTLFLSWGINSTLISFAPGRPSFYSYIEGSEPGSIVLSGHLDTVAPLGSRTLHPFTPIEEGNRIYGLGSSDMKGGVAMLVEGFKFIKEKGKPKHTVKLLLSADEEYKYRGAEIFQKSGILDDVVFTIVAEPTENEVLLGEKSEFWVRTTFIGKEAHGSTPEEGINSIISEAQFVLSIKEKINSLSPYPIMGSPTMNVGKIQGGRQPNIVPEKCFAEFDFRLLTKEQKTQVEEIIKMLGEKYKDKGEFSMETLSYKSPLISNLEDRFVKTFLEVAEQVTGKPQNPRAATFCTDLPTLFPEKVVPFVLFGPGSIKQAHQPDEFIEIESLSKSSTILEEFLLKALY